MTKTNDVVVRNLESFNDYNLELPVAHAGRCALIIPVQTTVSISRLEELILPA
jgi:hypothetical protein